MAKPRPYSVGLFSAILVAIWVWFAVCAFVWSGTLWVMNHGDAWWTDGVVSCCVLFCTGCGVTTIALCVQQFDGTEARR